MKYVESTCIQCTTMANVGDARRTQCRCQLMHLMNRGTFTKIMLAIACCACSYQPQESMLTVVDSLPRDRSTIGSDEPISIMFDDYLSLSSLSTDGIVLSSGDLSVDVQLSYNPVDKAIVIKPKRNLRVGIGYSLTIERNSILSWSGQTGNEEYRLSFRTDSPIGSAAQPISYGADIQPIFVKQCGCHGFEDDIHPNLDQWPSLVDTPSSRQPEFPLISPGQPLSSYLILRLLPDYPTVFGSPKSVTKEEVRRLVRWVRRLAP